jgi:GrpB-like predicted nucleotidyltransferase (UPF0157 family)
MKKIEVVPYNPQWKTIYNQLKLVIENHLEEFHVIIEHVGSTSVVGLWAKPILDIDLIYENVDEKDAIIQCLGELGYVHQGNLGIEGREAFRRESVQVPYDNHRNWIEHHLYLVGADCDALDNHFRLRDYLRSQPEAVKAYSKLKRELAKRFPNDIDSYIDGKTELIAGFLHASGMESQSIEKIVIANKK